MKTKTLIALCFGNPTMLFAYFPFSVEDWFVNVCFVNFAAMSLCVEVYADGEQEIKRGLYPYMVSQLQLVLL